MHNSLDIFQTASAMASHAGARQAVVARNIANADTPGFQAERIAAFKDVYQSNQQPGMRVTREGHMHAAAPAQAPRNAFATGTPSPNGNTVSVEEEMLQAVAVSREHNRALSIYRHALTVLRTSIGRG